MYGQTRFLLSRHMTRDSWLHRLEPVTKALVFGLTLVAIFSVNTWLSLAFVSIYLLMLCLTSKTRLSFYLGSLKNFAWMFAITFGINLVFPRNGSGGAFSYSALTTATHFTLRLALMIVAATLLTVVMAPSEIGDVMMLFGRSGGRLGRLASDFATLLTIAIRFVPVLAEEAERIKAAQILRGRKLKRFRAKVAFVVDLIIPLIEAAMRRSTNLGFALEARCYGSHSITPQPVEMKLRDGVALALSGLLVAGVLLKRFL